jgi:hypothetical protein
MPDAPRPTFCLGSAVADASFVSMSASGARKDIIPAIFRELFSAAQTDFDHDWTSFLAWVASKLSSNKRSQGR